MQTHRGKGKLIVIWGRKAMGPIIGLPGCREKRFL